MTDASPRNIDQILERLPHRYPFLMVDRVIDVVPGKSIVAVKNVTANEAYFQGHFPGYPVMPGVLIIEALAQAGGILAWESASDEERIWILYLVGVEETRFKQTVRPGDQLTLRAEKGVFHGDVDGELLEVLVALRHPVDRVGDAVECPVDELAEGGDLVTFPLVALGTDLGVHREHLSGE